MIPICTSVRPDFRLVEELLEDDFQTAQLSNFGPCYDRLCEELSVFLDLPAKKRIVLTSSGHTALMAAYEVACKTYIHGPAYTFPSTWLAVGVDSSYNEYDEIEDGLHAINVDDDTLFSAVTALSVIPDLNKLDELETPVVVDGAPSFGTPGIYGYGDYYCLSFHATKTFPIGEGGAVICDKSEEPYMRRYISFGMNKKKEVVDESAINGKLSEYACAIGLSILPKMKEVIERRLENAAIYKELLGELTPESWVEDTVYQVFPIYLPSAAAAKKVRAALNQAEIQYLQYYRPHFNLPGAQRKYKTNVCLPVHQNVSKTEIRKIAQTVLSTI